MTTKMTVYRIDAGPRERRVLRLMVEAEVTLLRPHARAVLVNRFGRRHRIETTHVMIEFPWLALSSVQRATRGEAVALTQLVVGFADDPRGGYMASPLLPVIHGISYYYTCLGTYPASAELSHVNYFTTPFSALMSAPVPSLENFLAAHDPHALATVRERAS